MTQSFDEHWEELCIASNCTEDEALIHFEAGAASRQAEIDNLSRLMNEAVKAAVSQKQAEIDALQKRINDALCHTINHGGYDDLTHIINILKGESK